MGLIWTFPVLAEDHVTLFLVGVVILACQGATSVYAFSTFGIKVSLLGIIFTFVTFTAFIDTFIALSLAIDWFEWGRFYVDTGEKYFRCVYGFMCLFWDGTFHVFTQGPLAFLVLTGRSYHFLSLVWAGSVLNSMAPLLLGASTGPYSGAIQLSTALNGPYVFLPIVIILYQMSLVGRERNIHGSRLPAGSSSALVDCILLGYNLLLPAVHLIRVLCVLESEAKVATYWKNAS